MFQSGIKQPAHTRVESLLRGLHCLTVRTSELAPTYLFKCIVTLLCPQLCECVFGLKSCHDFRAQPLLSGIRSYRSILVLPRLDNF